MEVSRMQNQNNGKELMEAQIFDFGAIGSAEIGFLTAAQVDKNVPFQINRVYWTYKTPSDFLRGKHAHRELKQIIFALAGELEVEIETPRRQKKIFKLNKPQFGLYIPELHWRNLKFSENAVLLSLASLPYDEKEYIRDYSEFETICLLASEK
jgi:hypothetical protein